MCETFKLIKLLVVELQKNGLQIPVKKILWANDCERRESFSKYVKNANICPFVVRYQITRYTYSEDVSDVMSTVTQYSDVVGKKRQKQKK